MEEGNRFLRVHAAWKRCASAGLDENVGKNDALRRGVYEEEMKPWNMAARGFGATLWRGNAAVMCRGAFAQKILHVRGSVSADLCDESLQQPAATHHAHTEFSDTMLAWCSRISAALPFSICSA
jgi:hypothetical protein